MRGFAKTPWGRILGIYLVLASVAPGALAQHAAKAIQKAAETSGLLNANDPDHEAKLKTLILAFDPHSPLDALQKLISLARAAPIGANNVGEITIQQICGFWENLKQDPDYVGNPAWKNFQNSYGAFIEALLYDKSYCGAGPIQSMIVQNAPDGRYVWLNLKQPLNMKFGNGTFMTRGKQLRFRVSDNPDHAARLLSDYATNGTNVDQLFKKIAENRVLQNQDAQEVATAITHLREAVNDYDPAKVVRTLSTYDTLMVQPVDKNDYLIYRPNGSYQNTEIGAIALLSPHGIASKSPGGQPFSKGIAVVRSYEVNGGHGIDGRIGQVALPPPKNNVKTEWKPVVEGTLESVNVFMDAHFDAIQKTGIGLMYGPKSSYAKLSDAQKSLYISQRRRPGTAAPVPKETSCVGFVLNQLEQGYKRAGKQERWKEIDAIVRDHQGDGNFLLQELKKDGWTTVYFNPDVKNPTQQVGQPSKPADHHIWTASEVKKGRNYLSGVKLFNGERFDGIPIDEQMLNYRPTNPYQTTPETAQLEKLRRAPLFVGIANGGYHVYLGSQGNVIESHSTRNPTDPTNMEIRPFSEWGLLDGESYLSGVIAVPPGGWE
jgi:hypothetical protein